MKALKEEPSTGAKVLAFIFAVGAVGIFCDMAQGESDDKFDRKIDQIVREARFEAQKKVEAKCIDEAEVVEVKDIFAMMESNEAALARTWKGSCVRVHGFVKDITEGPLGGILVTVNDGNKYDPLHVIRCEPKNESKALSLRSGQEIILKGVGGIEVMQSLNLDQCDW